MTPRAILGIACGLAVLASPWIPLRAKAQSEMVISVPGTPEYHRAGCARLRDVKEVLAMTVAQANGRGLKPHAECDPAQSPQEPGQGKAGTPAKLPMVLIDVGGKYYHRDKCAKLSGKTKRVTVTEAAKLKHWPCPTCKPPIRPRPGKS
jgi:hypothetical protein